MAPGHIVFFWIAGQPKIRGMRGWGVLASAALKDPLENDLTMPSTVPSSAVRRRTARSTRPGQKGPQNEDLGSDR